MTTLPTVIEPSSPLFIQLDVGLREEDLLEAEHLLGGALDVTLELCDDLELGGAYFEYVPSAPPREGLRGIRMHANLIPGIGWSIGHRPDLPTIARINLVSDNLLELGRVATVIETRLPDSADLAGYVVGAMEPGVRPAALWRAHWRQFHATRGTAWPGGDRDPLGAVLARLFRADSPPHIPQGGNDPDVAPLLCHLTLGLGIEDLADAVSCTESSLGLRLEAHTDTELNVPYFECIRVAAGGEEVRVMLRRNCICEGLWVFPSRTEQPVLFELTFHTHSLVDLGRIACALDALKDAKFEVLAYRVIGDLVRDGVPGVLERRFRSADDSGPSWHLGHRRAKSSVIDHLNDRED